MENGPTNISVYWHKSTYAGVVRIDFYEIEAYLSKREVETSYDEQGRIEEISTYFSGSNFRKITTYRYADGTVAGAQPTPEFEGGIYFGMDGKPLAELPMITLKGFSIDD